MKRLSIPALIAFLLTSGIAQAGVFFTAEQITYADASTSNPGVPLPPGALNAIKKAGRFDFEFRMDVAPGASDISGARFMMFSTANASDDGFGVNVNYSTTSGNFSFVYPRVEKTHTGGTGGTIDGSGYISNVPLNSLVTGYVTFNTDFTMAQVTITVDGVSATGPMVVFPADIAPDEVGETLAMRNASFIVRDVRLSVDAEIIPPDPVPSFTDGNTSNPETFGNLYNLPGAAWSHTDDRPAFGWFYREAYPWIYQQKEGWISIVFSGPEAIFFYSASDTAWYYTELSWYPYAYNLTSPGWNVPSP